ncbi:hypothetical protein F7725_010966 [Dissostichus mawsoni]|uniref:EFR3 homolog A (S. cerevisiae) n=1 Tax=Dissostichus mawsoni TaxID=36200 RepID=A0A7J5Z7M4_DISMA|nr:hypothetical protein F7725_010966 [Dissostichus mawsoni]
MCKPREGQGFVAPAVRFTGDRSAVGEEKHKHCKRETEVHLAAGRPRLACIRMDSENNDSERQLIPGDDGLQASHWLKAVVRQTGDVSLRQEETVRQFVLSSLFIFITIFLSLSSLQPPSDAHSLQFDLMVAVYDKVIVTSAYNHVFLCVAGVCGCCGPLRPRYKRLVDNIFPEDPKDGLSKSDMEKLTFYAVSAPEKLDRIGAYLAEKLSRDVVRHRYGIKPFVESFLHMVAKLLESREPDLQVLGTNSVLMRNNPNELFLVLPPVFFLQFVKFANIEEDTPSYHRRYDFFVIRIAGIKGLQGVVRKTVNDELQAIIWEPQHMDKLIPSMLFNMQDNDDLDRAGHPGTPSVVRRERRTPQRWQRVASESCWDELPTWITTTCGTPMSLLCPASESSCTPSRYSTHKKPNSTCNGFKRICAISLGRTKLWQEMSSSSCLCFVPLQAQHSHHVIQQVLNHLDTNNKNTPRVRAGIVQVLLETVAIAAKGSVGPTVLEVFNTLLKHLRMSVDFETGEGFFGGNLPDYQRAEVMMFIMGKVPVYGTPCHTLDTVKIGHQGTKRIQTMLLSSLIMVTSSFKSKSMAAALSPPFLDPLFSISLMEDGELRQLHGQQLYRHIFLGCKEEDNGHKNFELLFTTLAVLTIELANEEVVIDLIRLSIALQDMALTNEENLPMLTRCAVLGLVAAYLNFLSQMIANPPFCQHVIELRTLDAPFLLPEHVFKDKCPYKFRFSCPSLSLVVPSLPEALDKEDRLLYFQTVDMSEYKDRMTRRKSFVDTISLQVDIISNILPDKSQLAEEITFETLKKAIAPFEEIAAHCESKANLLHDRLAQIFELTIRPPPSPSGVVSISSGHNQSVPVYEMKFPDLCVY